MGLREPSTAQPIAAPHPPTTLLRVAEEELERFHRRAEAARAGLVDWRSRLRATVYEFYRYLREDEGRGRLLLVELRSAGARPALLIEAEIEALCGLIDEGRAEPTAPPILTRSTADSLAAAIFWQLSLAADRDCSPPETELVPGLMYSAVLPYSGAVAATEELRIRPPPR